LAKYRKIKYGIDHNTKKKNSIFSARYEKNFNDTKSPQSEFIDTLRFLLLSI